ncbi:hypothetical protein CRUP_015241 [Coryphaenoides rupestris]|nr:hypothetical protein CRUP_015241 [Coryphaenoides rupestris]
MDKAAIPTSGLARLSVSDEHPSPASPPSSAPETYSSPHNNNNTTAPGLDDPLGGTINRARGQHYQKHPSSLGGGGGVGRGGLDGSLEDVSRERRAQHPSSSSPKKGSRRGEQQQQQQDEEARGPYRSPEEPHSPRRAAGQEPRERRRRGGVEEEERGDIAHQGTAERRKRDCAAASNPGPGTEEPGSRGPRGSSSSLQDPVVYNGTSGGKKAPITPGPWKVPSTSKIQSHVETSHEGF